MKPRHLLMGAVLVIAAGLVLFGDTKPDTDVAEAVERPATATPAPARVAARNTGSNPAAARNAAQETAIGRLIPREQLIGATGDDAFGGSGGVFAGQNLNPAPVAAEQAGPPPAPQAPTAPPLPFTVLGKGVANGAYEVYLARAERTYVVQAGTVIDGMYRVDAIAPPTLTITYLPLKQVQQLNIGVLD